MELFIFISLVYTELCSINNKCKSDSPCCSKWGYCGSTNEYCNNECNRDGSFNNKCILSDEKFNPKLPCTESNICPSDYPCCSQYGFCGSSEGHCGAGCNNKASFQNKCLQIVTPPSCSDSIRIDFKNGKSDKFTYDGPMNFVNSNLQLQIKLGDTKNPDTGIIMGYGGLLKSSSSFGYGKFKVRMNSARMPGIVTAFTLMSDDKDEIDWEWVGKNEFETQTNYYYKGELDYTKGKYLPVNYNTHTEVHEYEVHYYKDYINWLIDGNIVRSLYKKDTLVNGVYKFPTSKMYLFLSLWDGGSGAQGTRDWAGGQVNWNDQEYINNGGFMYSNVESISYEC